MINCNSTLYPQVLGQNAVLTTPLSPACMPVSRRRLNPLSITCMPPEKDRWSSPPSLLSITARNDSILGLLRPHSHRHLLCATHLAYEDTFAAVLAPFDKMVLREIGPVAFLAWAQNTCPVAEWADAFKCRKDCPADEFRTIGKVLNEPRQIFIYLERDDLVLSSHSLTILIYSTIVLRRIASVNYYYVLPRCQEIF